VVDNGSVDGSAEAISRECPDVRLICNPDNLGFAAGNNRGIVQALATDDAPILLLNNDAFVEQDDVLQLMDTLRSEKEVGIVGPLLYDVDDESRLLSAGGRDIVTHVNSHVREIAHDEPVREVDYVPGTVVLIRSQVFRAVGLLDEDYFFGGEIADLCERARRHGYISVIDSRARASHDLSRSAAIRERLHIYYVFRNRFLFIQKFRRAQSVPLCAFWTLYGLGMSVKAQLRGRPTKARAIRLGLLDGWRGRFGGQNERVLSLGSDQVA
jgi:GT2 family glycosyltransferase